MTSLNILQNQGSGVTLRAAAAPRQQRKGRYPKHPWQVTHRPYQIQPFMIAPVLPGETLTNALFNANAKTHALAADHEMIGWWLEHYVFYVKLTDLDDFEDFKEMLLDPAKDLTAIQSAADADTYHNGSGINYTQLCLDRVVDEYFRDEDDGTVLFDGLPQASIMSDTALQSLKLASVTDTDDQLPGSDGVVPDHLSADFSNHYAQWEHMRNLKMTNATFEDWVAAFGVKADPEAKEDPRKPELIRYFRDWQEPSVAIDGDGTTTSAVLWRVGETVDKRRFFNEPGFIFGVTVARPKVYLANQTGALAHNMDDAYAWLPATLRADPFTSLKEFAAAASTDGPLGSVPSGNYWVDMRDLLIYGDQFFNVASPNSEVALPAADCSRRFAAEADIDALFKDAVGGKKYIRQDGVASLSILSHQEDTT